MITALISSRILQDVFSEKLLGNYFGLFGLLGVFGAFCHAGVGLAAIQKIVGEGDDPSTTFAKHVSLSVTLGFVSSFFVLGGAAFKLTELSILEILLLTFSELMTLGVLAIATMSLQGLSFPAASRIRIGLLVIRLSVTVALYLTDNLSFRNLGIGFVACYSVYTILVVWKYLPRHGVNISFEKPSAETAKAGFIFSMPMASNKVQTDGDKYLLNAYGFAEQAGFYGLAYRGMQVAYAPLQAIEAAAFQRFLPREEGNKGLHWRRAGRFTILMLVVSLVVMAIMFLALPLLQLILFDSTKRDGAMEILPWLLGLMPLLAVSGTPLNGLLGLGRAKERGYLFMTSTLLSLILYVILIDLYGWRGAVGATYISEVFLIIISWAALWHYQQIADRAIDEAQPEP